MIACLILLIYALKIALGYKLTVFFINIYLIALFSQKSTCLLFPGPEQHLPFFLREGVISLLVYFVEDNIYLLLRYTRFRFILIIRGIRLAILSIQNLPAWSNKAFHSIRNVINPLTGAVTSF